MADERVCDEFNNLGFISPYDKSQAAQLQEDYWPGRDDVNVVYAQRGSCSRYKNCILAASTSLSLCRVMSVITHCVDAHYQFDSQDPANLSRSDEGRCFMMI